LKGLDAQNDSSNIPLVKAAQPLNKLAAKHSGTTFLKMRPNLFVMLSPLDVFKWENSSPM
jgi:hypothetical protein